MDGKGATWDPAGNYGGYIDVPIICAAATVALLPFPRCPVNPLPRCPKFPQRCSVDLGA
jgi:hypothetical protein